MNYEANAKLYFLRKMRAVFYVHMQMCYYLIFKQLSLHSVVTILCWWFVPYQSQSRFIKYLRAICRCPFETSDVHIHSFL